MGNVIKSCPNNKILLSSIKLNNPSESCLNCSKVGYQLNSTSSACICSTGFYSNNAICYPISCSSTGYMPDPNDDTMLQLVPLPYNINFIINRDATITTTNNDLGYYIISSYYTNMYNTEPFNNYLSNNSVELSFASDGSLYRQIFNRNNQYIIIKKDGTLFPYIFSGEFLSISLPYKITLKKYKLTFLNNDFPKNFYIVGTNLLKNDSTSFYNNNTWYILDQINFSSIPTNATNEYFLYNRNIFNNSFSTIAIVIDRAFTSKVQINQFHLYGTYGDNNCICAFDYYLPSGNVIKYDNGTLSGCVVNTVKPTITFYDAKGNTQQFLYNKYINNAFYFYRTTSDTCATNPTKNNITIIPKGFKTNFIISDIVPSSGILLSVYQGDCTAFNGIRYLDVTKISNKEYTFDLDLNQILFLGNQYELKFLKVYISY